MEAAYSHARAKAALSIYQVLNLLPAMARTVRRELAALVERHDGPDEGAQARGRLVTPVDVLVELTRLGLVPQPEQEVEAVLRGGLVVLRRRPGRLGPVQLQLRHEPVDRVPDRLRRRLPLRDGAGDLGCSVCLWGHDGAGGWGIGTGGAAVAVDAALELVQEAFMAHVTHNRVRVCILVIASHCGVVVSFVQKFLLGFGQ